MLMLYHILFIEGISNIKKYIFHSIVGGIIATTIFMILKEYRVLAFIFIFLIATIIVRQIYKKSIIVNIVELIISSIIVIVTELIVMVISILIVGHNDLPSWLCAVILLVTMSLEIYFSHKIIKFKKVRIDNFIEKYNSILIVCINIIIVFLFFKVLFQNSSIEGLNLVECGVLFIAIIVINLFYFIDLYKKDRNSKKSELKESINPLIQDLIDEMKASEHEYKNHLNILYCMIQVCKEDELRDRAKKYIGNVFENKNLLHNLSNIENTILKAVLLSKITQAEKNEIKCCYEINNQLECIPLDDSELTVVLSNLLNNAIEAASKSDKKHINIFTEFREEKHIIKVSNSITNLTEEMMTDISKVRFSTKGKGRGYGLYNIKNIINKYKGNVIMSLDSDVFNITIEI